MKHDGRLLAALVSLAPTTVLLALSASPAAAASPKAPPQGHGTCTATAPGSGSGSGSGLAGRSVGRQVQSERVLDGEAYQVVIVPYACENVRPTPALAGPGAHASLKDTVFVDCQYLVRLLNPQPWAHSSSFPSPAARSG
ncbi:hypothetical protein AB0I22_17105 [Streptomyces sp. NPDC050610]|uniref:hypothetical protein n=1 Tax=Streptomyces sp. NPDC050610 TaxID=3157097 RepID=UPI00342CCA8A